MNGVNPARSSSGFLKQLSLVCAIALALPLMLINIAFAQTADTIGPVIELEELADAQADFTQVFTVLIAEDVKLKDATLYYRRSGQLPFTPAPMETLGDTGYFSVSIPTENTDLRTIEYYVQARDEAGNRTVSGFAFDPYERRLTASTKVADSTTNETVVAPADIPSDGNDNTPNVLSNRWVQIGLGVLAVGIVASLAGGGGDSDSTVVPLTFNLE